MNKSRNNGNSCAIPVPTDWMKIYEEFIAEKRDMARRGVLSESAVATGNYLGLALYQLYKLGETPERMAELGKRFKAFHSRVIQ